MRVLIQRSPDPVPYRGAYVRLTGAGGEADRCSLVLAPELTEAEEREALHRLLGLLLALGESGGGGAPIRQHWLEEDGGLRGRADAAIAPRHAAEAERLAGRVRTEWDRFVGSVLARLRGEPRGDAHLRFVDGGWSEERPAVVVTAWPPLPGEALPPLH